MKNKYLIIICEKQNILSRSAHLKQRMAKAQNSRHKVMKKQQNSILQQRDEQRRQLLQPSISKQNNRMESQQAKPSSSKKVSILQFIKQSKVFSFLKSLISVIWVIIKCPIIVLVRIFSGLSFIPKKYCAILKKTIRKIIRALARHPEQDQQNVSVEKYYEEQNQIETSNQVLLQMQGQNRTYYIPTYLRFKLKNFIKVDLANLEVEINGDIIISFVYGKKNMIILPNQLVQRLKNQVTLNFQRDDPLALNQNGVSITMKQKKKDYEISFTVRQKFNLRIQPFLFWTPIQQVILLLPITIHKLENKLYFDRELNKKIFGQVRFNFMDHKNKFVKISVTDQTNFGHYSLIQSEVNSFYKKERITSVNELFDETEQSESQKSSNTQKINNFQYCYFTMPIFKYPMVSLAMIFLPLWSLAIIKLGIYFQSNQLSQRISSLASLMIAFIALLPTIRSQIPPHPGFVCVQYLVYGQVLASLLIFFYSYTILDADTKINWKQNIYFLISLGILIFQIISVALMIIFYLTCLLPFYKSSWRKKKENNSQITKINKPTYWGNKECDRDLRKIIQKVSILRSKNEQPLKNQGQNYNESIEKQSHRTWKKELIEELSKSLNQLWKKE